MIVAACVGILSLNRILSMPFWSLKGLLFGWFLYTHPVPCHLARLGTCFPHPQHPTLTLGARHALTLPTNKAVCFHGAAWFLLFHLLGMSLPLASWQTPRHPSLVLNPSFRCVRPPSRGPLPRSCLPPLLEYELFKPATTSRAPLCPWAWHSIWHEADLHV